MNGWLLGVDFGLQAVGSLIFFGVVVAGLVVGSWSRF